ncbi:MAG: PASTA domain-containing protein [Actinomycetota bacterium]
MPGADTDHDVGRVLGQRYQLEQRIGIGASAVVYQATDLNLRRSVAVKQLKPELSGDSRFIKLFRSEAHLAGQLDHPNVLTIHDWSADEDGRDGGAYIVTEYLTGGTLRQLLDREGPLPIGEIARIGLQVAQGLRAAHAAGLVHRDVKPGNILFGADGRVRIGDFGIARAVAEAAWTEPEGHLIGTARYAAPEQGGGGEVNGRADVYSLAVCLIEMATDEVPLVGESALATMMQRRDHDIPVEPALGSMADLVAWAGLAEWAARPTADQLVTELAALHGIAGLDPVTVIDLTSGPAGEPLGAPAPATDPRGGPPRSDTTPAWREGDPSDDVAIAGGRLGGGRGGDAGDDDRWYGDDASNDDGHHDGFDDDGPIGHRDEFDDPMAARSGSPLGDHTDDGYLTSVEPDGSGRSRGRLMFGLLAFALATAGAVAGGWYLANTREQPTEAIDAGLPTWPVPDFVAAGPAGAAEAVQPFGWTVSVVERHVDGTEPGEVLEQSPPPGDVRGIGGTEIELVVSLGPVPRTVPELIGVTEAEARQAIGAARLSVGSVAEVNDEQVDAGVVLEATIEGRPAEIGAEHPTGTTVDLVLSAGPAPRTVPDVVGSTPGEAEQTMAAVGLLLATNQDFSQSVPEGRIISMSPAPGTEVPRDSTVTVTVSLGLPIIAIPDLTGRPVLEAVNELSALGFTVRIEGAAEADVLGTRPQAGAEAREGATVTIVSTQE